MENEEEGGSEGERFRLLLLDSDELVGRRPSLNFLLLQAFAIRAASTGAPPFFDSSSFVSKYAPSISGWKYVDSSISGWMELTCMTDASSFRRSEVVDIAGLESMSAITSELALHSIRETKPAEMLAARGLGSGRARDRFMENLKPSTQGCGMF